LETPEKQGYNAIYSMKREHRQIKSKSKSKPTVGKGQTDLIDKNHIFTL